MSSAVTSVEDVVNLALGRLGYRRRIGNIYEGSAAAKLALDIYAQTRDQLLRLKDWPFAIRQAQLTAVPAETPPTPWQNEYQYPSDCLRLKGVSPSPVPFPDFDPHPVLFSIWNDNRPATPVKAILSMISPATAIYIGQVTDMTTWEPLFVDALAAALAKRMAPALAIDRELVQGEFLDRTMTIDEAASVDDTQAPTEEAMPGYRQPPTQQR